MKHRIAASLAGSALALGLLVPAAYAASANPSQNLPLPASGDGIAAIDQARAQEGLAALQLPADYSSLTPAEQLLVLLNDERTARGLTPAVGLATDLDAAAAAGAAAQQDPVPPSGASYTVGASVWGEAPSMADVVFGWMYDDGWGGSTAATPNLDCTSPTASGCWGHRDAILGDYGSQPLMGAAVDDLAAGEVSAAAIFTDDPSGQLPAMDATWAQVSGSTGTTGTTGTTGSTGNTGGAGTAGTTGTGGNAPVGGNTGGGASTLPVPGSGTTGSTGALCALIDCPPAAGTGTTSNEGRRGGRGRFGRDWGGGLSGGDGAGGLSGLFGGNGGLGGLWGR